MKATIISFFAVIALFAFAILAQDAEATTICQGGTGPVNANVCQGYGHVSTTTGGVASARCFAVRTTNTEPTCSTSGLTPQNEVWQLVADQCITFYYFETTSGAVPPLTPNKLVLSVAVETSGTAPRVYKDGTVPPDASGTSYSFCATSDGTSGGSPRAGTYRIFLRAIKDNGLSTQNYNINNDGQASVGSLINFDRAALRAQTLISDIDRNAYPSGAMFAYGIASDELVTITTTFTQPNGDVSNLETMRNGIIDEATLSIGAAGPITDVDATTLVQSFVADLTFPFANNPYVGSTEITGTSLVTGLKWTVLASTGHGSCVIRLSDLVAYCDEDITIDARIVFDSDGVGTFATADDMWLNKLESSSGLIVTKFNRAEIVYVEGYLFNARSQQLTRSMTVSIEDISAIVCNTGVLLTPSSGKYSTTYTVPTGGSCIVANTDTGSERYLRAVNTDQNKRSGVDTYVSSLYYVDTHIQISSTLNKDDFPTENANEDFTYIISLAQTDTVHLWCHVKTVRKDVEIDTSGNTVSFSLVDPNVATRLSGTDDTESDGWTTPSKDLLASTPLGTWTANCGVVFNGNSGSYAQEFMITVEGGGGNNAMPGDPIKVSCTPVLAFVGQEVRCLIAETLLDGTGRTGNAAGTNIDIRAPDESIIVSDANPIEWQHGIYIYDFTPTDGEGYYSFAVETIDVDTMDPIPGIYALYVQSGLPISGNVSLNNTAVLNAINEHRERSFEFNMNEFLLLAAIAFFVFMGETRKDALYWFFTMILSIYLLINRSPDSIIPLPIYLGWIFITLYQAVSLLMTKRAQNLSNTEE